MNHKLVLWSFVFLLSSTSMALTYPHVQANDVPEDHFGITVHDPYRSLEQYNSKVVVDWALAENRLTRSILDTSSNRKQYLKRLHEIDSPEYKWMPLHIGNRLFYIFKPEGKEREIIEWRDFELGPSKVLIDLNSYPPHQNKFGIQFDAQGRRAAVVIGENSDGPCTTHIFNVDTGQEIEALSLGDSKAAYTLTADGMGIFYEAGSSVKLHLIGDSSANDSVVEIKWGSDQNYGSNFIVQQINKSHDGKWLFVGSYPINSRATGVKTYKRVYLIKNLQDSSPLIPLATADDTGTAGTDGDLFDSLQGKIYRYSKSSKPNGEIQTLSENLVSSGQWEEYVSEDPHMSLSAFSIWSGKMYLHYLNQGATQIVTKNLVDGKMSQLKLPGVGMAKLPRNNYPYISFESIAQPEVTYVQNSEGRWALSNFNKFAFDPSQFQTKEVFYPSKDGTLISMFIVTKEGIVLDGKMPFVIEGYGGFADVTLPEFNENIIPWLEAGGGYALVNLRGGGEYGESWHQAGMLERKQNTFDDAITAAEYLIDQGYTNKNVLAIKGASNGGLLVSAVVTERPDLFAAAICGVPLTDMIRFPMMGYGFWYQSEYGDPGKQADFKYLYAYSPYHHISNKLQYPAILFTAAGEDVRVTPAPAFKAVAAFQANQITKNPILLSYKKGMGHQNATPDEYFSEGADSYGFIMDQFGMK